MYTITVLGQDYTAAGPLHVTFLSGVAMLNDIACANISILDDDSLEGLHSFTVNITGVEVESGLPAQLFIGSPAYATVYICDNEGTLNNCQTVLKNDSYSFFCFTDATVAFNTSEYTVSEDADTVHVCVVLNSIPGGGLECEIMATLEAVDGIKAGMYLESVHIEVGLVYT